MAARCRCDHHHVDGVFPPRDALYECYNPMPYDAAPDTKVWRAIALREKDYSVWRTWMFSFRCAHL